MFINSLFPVWLISSFHASILCVIVSCCKALQNNKLLPHIQIQQTTRASPSVSTTGTLQNALLLTLCTICKFYPCAHASSTLYSDVSALPWSRVDNMLISCRDQNRLVLADFRPATCASVPVYNFVLNDETGPVFNELRCFNNVDKLIRPPRLVE